MTRATLLSLLAHPTALTGADVRALEALAEAFPYCQTAHLLLAKAAHDQDSMLAGQRLRRAATYAADRTLLRQLIEQPPAPVADAAGAPAVVATLPGPAKFVPSPPVADAAAPLAAPPVAANAPNPASTPAAATADEAVVVPATASPTSPVDLAGVVEPTPATDVEAVEPVTPATPEAAALTAPAEAATAPAAPVTAEATQLAAQEAAGPNETGRAAAATSLPASQPEVTVEPGDAPVAALPEEPTPPPTVAPAAATEASPSEATPAPAEAAPEQAAPTPEPSLPEDLPTSAAEAAPAAVAGPATETELPAQAPPVRLPEQAEAARHEFGLAPADTTQVAPYQLPELELGITVPLPPGPATPRLPAFSGVPDVAYAPGEGSRLGFCLVPTAEAAPDQVPPDRLPPAGEYFTPDALLTEHVASPPTPPPSPLDLIDSFLQRDAATPRRRPQPPATEPQTDLSARSTRVVPELASESLALILVRQGKTEQAITIYERLMVKNPEKMAYFAAQIDQLRPPA